MRIDCLTGLRYASRKRISRIIWRSWLFVVLAPFLLVAGAQALSVVTQGVTTNDKVVSGSIVSLNNGTADTVSAATADNANSMYGVVVNSDDALLSLENSQGVQIQVATNGIVQTLVSNINGTISQGDPITISPIVGVGMKATANAKIIGVAQASLAAGNSSNQTYTDKADKKHTVLVGEVPVLVNVTYYYKQPDKTIIPGAVQSIANALAGKQVDPLPIVISAGIFIVTLVVVVSIIYSMIRSSIISVGRNPMSQSAIYRDVIQLSALVLGILGVAGIAIYVILTRL